MIRFLGQNNFNTYIYAPKNDPKHRDLWRENYTADEKEQIKELVTQAEESGVHFTYSLSPGVDFDYSDAGYERDFTQLIEKYDSVYQLGVRHFALLLDDLAARTAETAACHVRLVNDFRQRFFEKHTDMSELICIFAEYYDTILTEGYSGTIANQLNPDVIVMWTGPSIALQMSAASFDVPSKLFGRKMLLWWNYPVNDYCTDNLLADGVRGLSADLKEAVVGIVSNPMNQASKLPLATLADYMENPDGYQYAKSYEKALNSLFPETAASVRMLLENLYASQINNYTDSVHFKELISAFEKHTEGSTEALYNEFEKLKTAVTDIRENCANRNFVKEITLWLDKALRTASMGVYFLNAVKAENDKDFWEYFRLFNIEKLAYNELTAVFSGRVLTPFLLETAPEMLRSASPALCDYSGKITVQKVKGIPSASLDCYQDYKIENINSENEKTFYWSRTSATEGYWIMLDLGSRQKMLNIVLKSGCSPAGLDYIRKGQMQYSTDGVEWQNIGAAQT
jgi:hyaluronoglucosaminidase